MLLDRRQFLGSLAAAIPTAPVCRILAPRQLPDGKRFTLYRNFVGSFDHIQILDLLQSFNSRHWRGEKPKSVQLEGFDLERTGEDWKAKLHFARRTYPEIRVLGESGWKVLDVLLYKAIDFNEFDFGNSELNQAAHSCA